MKKLKEETPKEKPQYTERSYDDRWDIIKHGSGIHSPRNSGLTEDLLFAYLDPSQKRFAEEYLKIIEQIQEFIPDKKVGKHLADDMRYEIYVLANLERNKPDNPIQMALIKPEMQEQATPIEETMAKVLKPKKENIPD